MRKNIWQCSSFIFMKSCKTLLINGIPKGPFGCVPCYHVWGPRKHLAIVRRLIEHRPCANPVLRAEEIERNEWDSLWPWEGHVGRTLREIAGLGDPYGEMHPAHRGGRGQSWAPQHNPNGRARLNAKCLQQELCLILCCAFNSFWNLVDAQSMLLVK